MFGQRVIFLFILVALYVSVSAIDNLHPVILQVYSGRRNPVIALNSTQISELESLLSNNSTQIKNGTYMNGYKGFHIDSLSMTLYDQPEAEAYLLKLFQGVIPITIYEYLLQRIKTINHELLNNNGANITNLEDDSYCDNTPIKGPSFYPKFDPVGDNFGCFVQRQTLNNCYNYATDVLTNTFAQPGKGSTGLEPIDFTCLEIITAAIKDGLEYVGMKIEKKLEKGHYVALLIWPDNDFHWVRLDEEGTWSHKPGEGNIINTDSNGFVLYDPSVQYFGNWTEFCGYMRVVPGDIKIE
jgi:hypothetical protein